VRAAIHVNSHEHQRQHGAAMKAGLERHGITVDSDGPSDFAVTWGWKNPGLVAAYPHVLVMERGHVGDRMAMASCGWDGLGYRGRYPAAQDGGARWQERHGRLMEPWRMGGGDYALLIGQVEDDAAVASLPEGFHAWASAAAAALIALGHKVVYRPHPFGDRHFSPEGAAPSWATRAPDLRPWGSLVADLACAALCVTFNSTAGVEAVLAGVPTVTRDAGAMAWPVATHDLTEPLARPDREAWAHALAWTQWTLDEIARGDAWESLAPIMEAA